MGLIDATPADVSVAGEYGGGGGSLPLELDRVALADLLLRCEDDLGSCSVDDEMLSSDFEL